MSKLIFNKKLHKWLSLVVGLQLMIWLITGVYFNLMDHEKASGNIHREFTVLPAKPDNVKYYPINQLNIENPESIKLIWILNKPYYAATLISSPHAYQVQNVRLFDAVTGNAYTLNQQTVKAIAQLSYKGSVNISSSELIQAPIDELPSERNDVWRVTIDDDLNTVIYISDYSGQVLAHITDDKRLRDFMFMLHFMDYGNNGGFNHWLIIVFAVLTLVFSISGVIWTVQLVGEKQYRINIFSRHKKQISVQGAIGDDIKLYHIVKDKTVLEGLTDLSINLPSTCEGAGTCGQCKFTTENHLPLSHAEQTLLSPEEVNNNVRLGCQHRIAEIESISLS